MIPEVQPVKIHYGNNEATIFDFDFYLESEEQLLVEHTNMAGIKSILTYGVDYSVEEFGNPDGSKITFPLEDSLYNVLAWDDTTGKKEMLVISLDLPLAQEAEFDISGDLNKENLETALDYEMRCIQILSRKIDRAIKVEEGSEVTSEALKNSLQEAQINAERHSLNAKEQANIATAQANIVTTKAEELEVLRDLATPIKENIDYVRTVSNNIDDVTDIAENLDNILNKTVHVGQTFTGKAGTSAKVENVGTRLAPILNFTIPQGIKGDDGGMGAEYDEDIHAISFYKESGSMLYPRWGNVQGDITIQEDLQELLKTKQDKGNFALRSELAQGLNNKQDKGNYALASDVPTLISQLENDKNFATQAEVLQAIASIPQFKISIVNSLPTTGERMTLYMVPKSGTDKDIYNEYVWIEQTNSFEFVGTTAVDLTNYATKNELSSAIGDIDSILDEINGEVV